MTYDLAAWEGPRPSSARAAADTMDALLEQHAGSEAPPADAIRRFVTALTERWPDTEGHDDPWSDTPVLGSAHGPVVHLVMHPCDELDDVVRFAAATGRRLGLVVFDPQTEELL